MSCVYSTSTRNYILFKYIKLLIPKDAVLDQSKTCVLNSEHEKSKVCSPLSYNERMSAPGKKAVLITRCCYFNVHPNTPKMIRCILVRLSTITVSHQGIITQE